MRKHQTAAGILHSATVLVTFLAVVFLTGPAPSALGQITAFGAPAPFIEDSIATETSPGPAPQVSTAELRSLLSSGLAVLIDARPPAEFGMSHIPGAVNVAPKPGVPLSVYVSDVEEVKRLVADRSQLLVLYCNGPFCGKSKRLAAELDGAGYTNLRRYQLGMPGWRTTGGVAVIEVDQMREVAKLDRTAVFVDAGLGDSAAGRKFGHHRLVRIATATQAEMEVAKNDGRLPINDHNTRMVVIGANAAQAITIARLIAANAFHNVSYYDGDGDRLLADRR